MASSFYKWFAEQFGKPVFKDQSEAQAARDNLKSMRPMLAALEAEMRRHEQYEENKRAALYAWNVKPPSVMPKKIAASKRKRPR